MVMDRHHTHYRRRNYRSSLVDLNSGSSAPAENSFNFLVLLLYEPCDLALFLLRLATR